MSVEKNHANLRNTLHCNNVTGNKEQRAKCVSAVKS